MARLADQIALGSGDRSLLSPSLRAALRLTRHYGGFGPILLGIQEGSVSVIGRVIGECSPVSAALADLFDHPGRSLASRIAELRPIATELVAALLGTDPDQERHQDDQLEDHHAQEKPTSFADQYEQLFGFATGILKWSPSEAWNATPGEIIAAYRFRQKAFAPAKSATAAKPHHELTLDQQADLFAAQLQARFGRKSDAV